MRVTEDKKYDRRQRRSRSAVFAALARLLRKKNFEEITVQEIIDEADVGRSTFYAHFETKDGLLREMCRSIFDHVLEEHQHREASHDFSLRSRTLPELLSHILYHLQDEKEEMLDILRTGSAGLFLRYFAENLSAALQESPELLPRGKDGIPEGYRIRMIAGGIVETVRWWAERRMEYSPEQVAGFYAALLPGE